MSKIIFVFGITCLFTIVGTSVQGEFDVGKALISVGTAVNHCLANVPFPTISPPKRNYCMTACMAKQLNILGSDNKLNFANENAKLIMTEIDRYVPVLAIVTDCSEKVTNYSDECDVVKDLIQCVTINGIKKLF